MKRFNLEISDIHDKKFNANWKIFKKFWLQRIDRILIQGMPLVSSTKGRLRLQIKIVISAANLLVNRMKEEECDLFNSPPKLSKIDWLLLLCRCILTK